MKLRRAMAAVAAIAVLGGCATEPGRRRDPAPPPANMVVTDMLPFVSFMEDTDSNGYRDTAVLTVLLFARNYADASIAAEGAMEVRMVGKGGTLIREWKIPPEVFAGLAKKMPAGPAYYIRLSLLEDSAGDRIDETTTDLHLTFSPTGGNAVRVVASGVTVGRAVR
jgi:hypothetical protein